MTIFVSNKIKMKKTGDPLKTVATNKPVAESTNVKVGMAERMSNIPNRFAEKQAEQEELNKRMSKGGYIPKYDSKGNVMEYQRFPGTMKVGGKEFENVKGTNTYKRKK